MRTFTTLTLYEINGLRRLEVRNPIENPRYAHYCVDFCALLLHFTPARGQTLSDLGLLRLASQATLPEVMAFIEREKLFGVGCGLVDVALLASTLMTPGARLWSLDKRLAALADRFGVGYRASVH